MTQSHANRNIPSPIQQVQRDVERAFNLRDPDHPAREDIQKCLGSYDMTAIVEEDTHTLSTMRHIPGLIAFLCTLKRGGEVVSQGRGSSVLNPNNRYIERAVRTACNASLVDACIRGTRVLDTFMPNGQQANKPQPEVVNDAGVTDKQLKYLRELIRVQVHDEDEREQWEANIEELTRKEASDLIASFRA